MSIPVLKIPFDKEFIVQGDTISQTELEITEDGIDLTTSTIKMQVYDGNNRIIDVSNGNGITIVDSENLIIDEVAKENNDLPVGTFLGDFEITDSSGVRNTYFRVQYEILKQYTV